MLSTRIVLLALATGLLAMLSAAPTAFAAPPANDEFQDAIVVSALPYSNSQLTDEATMNSADEPFTPNEPVCGDIDATVWYSITAPQSGILKVSTQGSDFDTVLAAYSGTGLNLQSLGCNDDTGGGSGLTSAVQFEVIASTTYYIQAGGYLGAFGQLTIIVLYGITPANDDFAGAVALAASASPPSSDSRDTIVATTESDGLVANEPGVPPAPDICAPIDRTVWYSFTPGQTNLMNATTAGSNFDTVLAVYTGGELADLSNVACSDDFVDTASFVQFTASADTTYWIQIGGYNGDSGDLALCLAVDTSDSDCDGFTDENETLYIGTGAIDPCGSDGWPADLAGNDNTLNIGDFNSFVFPLRTDGSFNKFGHPVPDPQDASIDRWNLDPNDSIGIGDLNALNPAVVAPTSRPPMFQGQPAFFTNSGECPFPP